jgi:hypothetical protein
MLKLYTKHQYVTPENRKIIFPLLFDLCYTHNLKLLEKYQIVSCMEDCDIAIVPVDIAHFITINKEKELYNFIDEALELQKKVWVYSAGDQGLSVNRPVYTFRMGGFDSQLNAKTVMLPSFISDPYTILQKAFKPIPKSDLPKIGFVGHASNSCLKRIKEALVYLAYNFKRLLKFQHSDYQFFYPSSVKRYQFLSALQKNNKINTDFVFRNQYRAGVKNEEDKQKTTLEFLENIYSSPYTFCLRGAGNFSVRFCETLAMGRIPFVIDTDIRLPLAAIIPWEKHCVIATEKDFMEQLIRFHKNITKEEFEQMQINNRNLWLSYLNREAYFDAIYAVFKKRL